MLTTLVPSWCAHSFPGSTGFIQGIAKVRCGGMECSKGRFGYFQIGR